MDFLSEEELQNLTPKQLEKEANKYIYQQGIKERKQEYPVLKGQRIAQIKRKEILMDPDSLRRCLNGEFREKDQD